MVEQFAEALEMNNFPFTKKTDNVVYIGVV